MGGDGTCIGLGIQLEEPEDADDAAAGYRVVRLITNAPADVSGLIVEGDRRVCPLLKSLSRQVSHSLSLSLSPSLSLAVAPFFFSLPCFLSLPSLQVYFSLLPCFFFSLPSCSSSSLGPHMSQPFANSRDEQIPRPLCLIMVRLLFGHTRESSLVTEACLAGSKKAGLWACAAV